MNGITLHNVNELRRIAEGFQDAYHQANLDAVLKLGPAGWERLWDVTIKSCATELLDRNADHFAVRQKLEAVADAYRRTMCNPLALFSTLHVQDTIAEHMVNLEHWCDKNRAEIPIKRTSDAWQVMRMHAETFYDWTPGAPSHFVRLPWNLYANPHHGGTPPGQPLCSQARQRLLFCAIAETARLMDSTPPKELCISTTEWEAYRKEVCALRRGRGWVDVEDIAAECFNIVLFNNGEERFGDSAHTRQPLMRAEQTLYSMIQQLSGAHLLVLQQWLQSICFVTPKLYIGARFPPPFIALLCDIIMENVGDSGVGMSDMNPHPLQAYSPWVAFGIHPDPTIEELTAGWDPSEIDVLTHHSGRFEPAVFQFWNANRRSLSCE